MDKLKIWIIHYTKLIDRKIFLDQEIPKLSVPYEYIEKYDKEDLKKTELMLFNLNKIKLSMCSNIRKHIEAYKNILKSPYKYNLILEDDVIINKNFKYILNQGLSQLPINYDMLFIGDGLNMHIPNRFRIPNKLIYYKGRHYSTWGGDGATRCTDSYIISKNCAKKILFYILKLRKNKRLIDMNSDWWLNQVIRDLKLNIYWLEPTIVSQGTQNGKYKSSH